MSKQTEEAREKIQESLRNGSENSIEILALLCQAIENLEDDISTVVVKLT